MAPKRTPTSPAPAMSQAAIRKLVANSVAVALEAQATTMANTDNTNRNTRQSGTCNTPKLGRSGIRVRGVLLHRSITQDVEGALYPGWNSFAQPIGIEEAYKITWTLHCQVSYLQQGGSSDQELQKQRVSQWKQPAASVSNLSCLWRKRAL
ncbi:hypothetical protein Tco_1182013 [Tanacetum coccineum]